MTIFYITFLLISLIKYSSCEDELSLKILKSFGDNIIPVTKIVVEKAGANFSLLCDLVSSANNTHYDYQMSWVKPIHDVRFWREQSDSRIINANNNNNNNNNKENPQKVKKIYSVLPPSDLNKVVKHFQPLKPEDKGQYLCVSLKYNLHKLVEVVVKDDTNKPPANYYDNNRSSLHDTIVCSDQMFQCVSTGLCIIYRYICDGKPDCKDGSDESEETCHGDPCKDKLYCENGRCIPTSWCCDRHLDPNCTVTNRPKCCQLLSDSYEELEYGSPHLIQTHTIHHNNGARYIFITVCILSILFFIILLFLILSKVMIFAKKSAIQQRNLEHQHIENIALRNTITAVGTTTIPQSSSSLVSYHNHNRILIDNCDVSDPLLYQNYGRLIIDDQPPPYIDVISLQNNRLNHNNDNNNNEPPPPYTSHEILNIIDN